MASAKDLAMFGCVNKNMHAVSCYVSQKQNVPIWTIKLNTVKDFEELSAYFAKREKLPLPKARIEIDGGLLNQIKGDAKVSFNAFMTHRQMAGDSLVLDYGSYSAIIIPAWAWATELNTKNIYHILDLRHANNLTKVTLGAILEYGKVTLPASVTELKAGNINGDLDLRQAKRLTKVMLGDIDYLTIPASMTELKVGNINGDLDLSQAKNLTKVTLEAIREYGNVTLPPSVTEFNARDIRGTLDLSLSKELKRKNCKIYRIQGKVLYPWWKEWLLEKASAFYSYLFARRRN